MTRLARCLWWLGAILIATIPAIRIWAQQAPTIPSTSYSAAYARTGKSGLLLTLFPLDGSQMTVPLPALPRTFRVIASSSDGRAIYTQDAVPLGRSEAIGKLELKAMQLGSLRGSVGLGTIWYLTDSQGSTKIFVSGSSGGRDPGQCGIFEIDSASGSFRTLRSGGYPQCGAGNGPVSADGRRVLSRQNNELEVLNLETGNAYSLGAGLIQGSWSPDGRRIAAWGAGRIVVIDADNPSRKRDLGKCCDNGAHWSPDSKYLLLSKSELRCTMYLYFASLEILDAETGKRTTIKSSRCNVGPGWVGWIDPGAVE